MKTFRHSGKIGDILFSLPTIRYFGGGILYIPESTAECQNLYSGVKSLIAQQPFIKEVREYPSGLPYGELAPDVNIDIDLDRHRQHPARGAVNMVKRYHDIFGIREDWKRPWLHILGERIIKYDYNLVSLTQRFRDNSRVDWHKVYSQIPRPVFFIGTIQEHETFLKNYTNGEYIERLNTPYLLSFAIAIRDCSAIYCNQSAALAVASGIDKLRYVDFKPRKTNCKFYTKNEFELL